MTDPNKTLVAALLDRSGSMETSKTATEDGWRELINEQRQQPGDCQVTLAQFDTVYEVVYPPTDIADVADFSVQPRGMTALLDATGRFITEIGEQLSALPDEERPGHVICLIMTDGMENSSHEWTWDAVRKLTKQQQDEWGWTFIFLGANIDAIEVGRSDGIRRQDIAHLRRLRLREHRRRDAGGQGDGERDACRRVRGLLGRGPRRGDGKVEDLGVVGLISRPKIN